MTMDVLVDRGKVTVSREVFVALLSNSVVSHRVPFQKAIDSGRIHFADLVELARRADLPYALFFAPLPVVAAQLRIKREKLLQGVSPETFTVNSRTQVELRDVELILKDLMRKQTLLRTLDPTLTRNSIVGILRKPRSSAADEAQILLEALELDANQIRSAAKSEIALDRIIRCLESKQILVSRSVRGFMPQLIEVPLSGMTIRDSKVPYIFLSGGDHLDYQEPTGRQIFTLVLMTVLVARGIFAPVTYDAHSTAPDTVREYEIVGEILMPAKELGGFRLDRLDIVRAVAKEFKVTPSAIVVRAMKIGQIARDVASAHLAELEAEFRQRERSQARTPNPLNAVRKYSSRELSVRLFHAVDSGALSAREFCRVVTLNRLKPSQLADFRSSLR